MTVEVFSNYSDRKFLVLNVPNSHIKIVSFREFWTTRGLTISKDNKHNS